MKDRVLKMGYSQHGLYQIIYAAVTNFNALLAKLDADLGDTAYVTAWAITDPSIGSTYGKNVGPNSMYLGDVVSLCKQLRTNHNALMDALAADDGVAGTTIFTATKFATTSLLIDTNSALVKPLGVNQGAIVDFLDAFVNQFNDALDACDVDGTLTDTDYFSTLYIEDEVAASSSSSSCRSSSSSCRSSSSSSSRSSSSSSSLSSSSSSRSSSSSSCRSSSSSSSSSVSSSSSSSCRSSSSSCRSSSSSSSSSQSSSSSSSSSSRSSSSSSSSSQSIG